jgi:Dyp-type peroxidase family
VAAPVLSGERDDIQGLLASGYGHLPHAAYLLFTIDDAAAAAGWLAQLADTVTTARARQARRSFNAALSAAALVKLGLSEAARAGFPLEFTGGMVDDAHRRRILGDVGVNAPELWAWGGPDTPPVDLLLLCFGETPAELALLADEHRETARGATLVLELPASSDTFDHFGFRDGISQPFVAGLRSGPPAQTIRAGEFLLGYRNEYDQFTDRPLLDRRQDPGDILPDDTAGSGMRDLGRNGSYLVFRQLSQDVPGFWRWVDSAAASSFAPSSRPSNGHGDPRARRVALASKLVGRWPGGAPLTLSPDRDDPALATAADFGYFAQDADGTRCPIGAHVRRSHPRDSLDPSPGTDSSIALDKHHRLLRRGRKYGSMLSAEEALASSPVDGDQRGLHFICLCANIERQYEFVQRTWVNSTKFDGLYDDADPLVSGGTRAFTVQAEPVRKRYLQLPSFVQTRGGGYFFLPGVRALRYLASVAEASS